MQENTTQTQTEAAPIYKCGGWKKTVVNPLMPAGLEEELANTHRQHPVPLEKLREISAQRRKNREAEGGML